MSKAPRLPARVFGVAALVLSGWLPASSLLAAPAVQVGFSPEGSAQQLVLSVVGETQRDIRLMGYAFARALIAAHRCGVTVGGEGRCEGQPERRRPGGTEPAGQRWRERQDGQPL